MIMPPRTSGVHHVGLSVSDLTGAANFFVEVLGFRIVGERPAYPALFSGRQRGPKHNEGLHHLALAVESAEALDDIHADMVARGNAIEFAPEPRADGTARHMMVNIPGGPRLELIAQAPAQHHP